MKIKHHGCVKVNHAIIIKEYPDLVTIGVDLSSKRAEIESYWYEGDDLDGIALGSNPETLYLVKGVSKDKRTVIEFPKYRKYWRVFSADISRYTLNVCLIKEDQK